MPTTTTTTTTTLTTPVSSEPRPRVGAVLLALLLVLGGCTTGSGSDGLSGTGGSDPSRVTEADPASYDAATRDDAEFNAEFTHELTQVDDVRMHYVTGGEGPPLVLLHGWPQTWYAWRDVMPALAEDHTVYALDLPGLGDSEGSPTSYDKATLARYVHRLLHDELGLAEISLVAHDLGAGVGFQYAAQFPEHVDRYAHLDYPLPGPALSAQEYRTFSWHLAFHSQSELPELLVAGRVEEYLAAFYPQVSFGGSSFGGTRTESPFSQDETEEYARTYDRPDVLAGGFELYRTLDEDERDNRAVAPIDVPTLLVTAQGGATATQATLDPLVAGPLDAVEVPGAGHWLVEENPRVLTDTLLQFLDRP